MGLGLLGSMSLVNLGESCLIGATNGVIVAVLIPGLLPIFEYLSRTTTDMELLELGLARVRAGYSMFLTVPIRISFMAFITLQP